MTKSVAELQDKIEELQEEILFLKREIRGDRENDRSGELCKNLRTSPQKGRLLFLLYKAGGAPILTARIIMGIAEDPLDCEATKESLRTVISQMNKMFPSPVVKNLNSFGYYLSPEGMEIVRTALDDA